MRKNLLRLGFTNLLLFVITVSWSFAPHWQAMRVENAVHGRVAELDLTTKERRWESIGWLTDVDKALDLARRYNRPIFVFAFHGDIDGRC